MKLKYMLLKNTSNIKNYQQNFYKIQQIINIKNNANFLKHNINYKVIIIINCYQISIIKVFY